MRSAQSEAGGCRDTCDLIGDQAIGSATVPELAGVVPTPALRLEIRFTASPDNIPRFRWRTYSSPRE